MLPLPILAILLTLPALGAAVAASAAPTTLPPAGRVPAHIRLAITGDPASPEFVRDRVAAAVEAAIRPSLVPGASIRAGATLPATQRLDRGFLTSFRVPVAIDPGEAAATAVLETATVDIENVALPPFAPLELAFHDDPERIVAPGVLSRTTIDVGRPTRIYYYHENRGERRRFVMILAANGSVRTHVAIVGAEAGPNIDVMNVGHAVTRTFLTLQPVNAGTLVSIAGGRPIVGRDTLVGAGDGIVGALDLRVIDGGPVTATVMAIPPDSEPAAFLYAAKLADDGHGRHGRFELADFGRRIVAYTAGGRDAMYTYGRRSPSLLNIDPADPGRDYGDYGVLHHVTFDLDNPAGAPVTLYLYEKPLGGVVRSSFVVNGTLAEVGCVRVAQPYLIANETLAPHATDRFDVLTMTDGGSNYPLEIGVTATPPLPSAPAIAAADGCFPKPGGPPAATQPGRAPGGL